MSKKKPRKYNTSGSSKKEVKFNQQVIKENQKKLKLLRKILNKIVSVVDKNYTCYQLKRCAVANFENLKPLIDDCDFNLNMSQTDSSSLDLNKKRKRKHSEKKINTTTTSSISNVSLDGAILFSDRESGYEDESDCDSSKLIQNLLEEQKKLLKMSEIKDTESVVSTQDRLNKREHRGARSLFKIKQLRNLPDYEKIEKILNAPKESYYKRRLNCSLNTIPVGTHERIEHWSTYNYLSNKVEQCIYKNDWNSLTKLLILLADAPKSYRPFFLKATLINIVCNPAAKHDENMLENYLKSCFSCQSERDMEKVLADFFHIKSDFDEIKDEEQENED